MGAANCCKKPEEVLDAQNITAAGGNYDNPHVNPLDKEGFPHDSESQILRSQNVLGVTNEQDDVAKYDAVKLNAENPDAKLADQYVDAGKMENSVGLPQSTGANVQYDAQNPNVITYQLPPYTTEYQIEQRAQAVDSAATYGLGGADLGAFDMAGTGAAYGVSGTANVSSPQAQNYDAQQVGASAANVQYESPKLQAAAMQGVAEIQNYAVPPITTTVQMPPVVTTTTTTNYQVGQQADAVQASTKVSAVRSPLVADSQNADLMNALGVQQTGVVNSEYPVSTHENEINVTFGNQHLAQTGGATRENVQVVASPSTENVAAAGNLTSTASKVELASLALQTTGVNLGGLDLSAFINGPMTSTITVDPLTTQLYQGTQVVPQQPAEVTSTVTNDLGALGFGAFPSVPGNNADLAFPSVPGNNADLAALGLAGAQAPLGDLASATQVGDAFGYGAYQTSQVVGVPAVSTVVSTTPVTQTTYSATYIPPTTTTTTGFVQNAYVIPSTTAVTVGSLGVPTNFGTFM